MSESVLLPALRNLFTTNSIEELGLLLSFYKATVKEIHSEEGKRHNIKVYCEFFHEKGKTSDWIKPLSLAGGNGVGVYIMPKVNDNIFVACVNGDSNNLLWLHGGWENGKLIKDAKPESYIIENDNLRFELDRETKQVILKTQDITFKLNQDTKKVKLEVNGLSLKTMLTDLITILQQATVSTALGAMPFMPNTQTALNNYITNKINQMFE